MDDYETRITKLEIKSRRQELTFQRLEMRIAELSTEIQAIKDRPWWKRFLGIQALSLIQLSLDELYLVKNK